MSTKAWVALIDWQDGDVEDTDEFMVRADSAASAESMVRAIWSITNGAKYPHARIKNVSCHAPAKMREFA